MPDEREIRIKMEFVVTTKFNVNEVRTNLRGDPGNALVPVHQTPLNAASNEDLLQAIRRNLQFITGAKGPARIACYSASYNRRHGRKDGERL